MKVTDNSTYRLMQANLNKITTELLTYRTQGSTGLSLNTASDDPTAIRPVLTTRNQIIQNDRYLETMEYASDDMEATDSYLSNVEDVLQRVKEIAINSVNASLSDDDLATLADEVAELKKELLDTANAMVDGKYIFAGYDENTIPFAENPDYDPEYYDKDDISTWAYIYNGDYNPTQLEITPGEYMETTLTGNELFMGITNEIAAQDYVEPYRGESMETRDMGVVTAGNDITLTQGNGLTIVIDAASQLNDDGSGNYSARVADAFNEVTNPINATITAETANLGDLDLDSFVDGVDTYQLDIESDATTTSVSIGGGTAYAATLEGLAEALGDSGGATDVTSEGGTLASGVSYDISSGTLVLTKAPTGSDINLSQEITDNSGFGPTGGLIETGLIATVSAARVDLGDLDLTNYDDGDDSYTLEITSGGLTSSVTLAGTLTNGYDFTVEDLAMALGSTAGATNLTKEHGTLANGVSYDISSGSLVLTGPDDGSEIELVETVTDTGAGAPVTGGIDGGDQTAYGDVEIAPDSETAVSLTGANGLSELGMKENTLDGASGNVDLFTVLTRLEEAIREGNVDDINGPGGSIQAQIADIEVGANQVRTQRSGMGARADRVETAKTHREEANADLQSILSRYQDADLVTVFTEITQQETAYQAALSVSARIAEVSILDYF